MKFFGRWLVSARPVIGSVEVLDDLRVLENRFHDQVAALEIGIIGRGLDPAEQRIAIGGLGAALHDLVGDQLVRIGLALLRRLDVLVDEHDLQAGLRRDIGDAGAHEARADDADLLELRRRHVGRAAGTLVQLLHRDEERADHRGRLLRPEYLGEVAALDLEAEIDRQLQPLVDRREDGAGGRVVVVGLAAIDRVGRRPDLHAGRRMHLVRGQLEALLVPGLRRLRIGLEPILGVLDDVGARRDRMDEAGIARRERLHLLALEHHLERVAGLHQA